MLPDALRRGKGQLEAARDTPERPSARFLEALVVSGVVGLFALAPLVHARQLASPFDLPQRAVLGIAGLAAAALARGLRAAGRRKASLPWEAGSALAFLALAALGLGWAAAPVEGIGPLRDFLSLLAWWLAGRLLLDAPGRLVALVAALGLAGSLTALLGLLQWAGLDGWRGVAGGAGFLASLPQVDAPAATFGHVNVAAEVVLIGCLALLGVFLTPGRSWSARVGVALPLGLGIAFLVVSGTRAAWLGLGLGVPVLAVLLARSAGAGGFGSLGRGLTRAGGLLLAGILLFLVLDQWVVVPGRGSGPDVAPRERVLELVDGTGTTVRERRVLWSNTLAMIGSRPWTGVGAGNWKVAYPLWSRSAARHDPGRFAFERQPERVHMDPLQVGAETGLPGVLLLLFFLGGASLRLLRATGAGRPAGWAASTALAVVAGVAGLSLVAFPFQDALPSSAVFLLLGAGGGLADRTRPPRGTLRLGRAGAATLAVGWAVVALVVALHFRGQWQASAAYARSRVAREAARQAPEGTGMRRRALLEQLDEADRAAARDPGNYRYQLERATALLGLGLGDDAAAALGRALGLHPNLANAMVPLADLRRRMGDDQAAWDLLCRARALHPEAPEVRSALGAWLVAAGRPEAALAHFEAALASPKWQPSLRLMRARLLLETGAPLGLALAELDRAEREAEISPDRMAECARLLSHPAFGALSPLFGATGPKTIGVWERVLRMTGNKHAEALLEVRMLPLKRALAGGPRPEPAILEDLLGLSRALLAQDPANLLARYYEAELLEGLQRDEDALRAWTLLLNGVRRSGVPARLESVINRAVRARERLEQGEEGG